MKKRMAVVFALFCMSGLVGCANDHTPLSDGTGASLVKREITISYANWTDESEIYFGALNSDKMTISSVQHLPIYRFDTKAEMEQFKNTFSETRCFDRGYNEIPSFNEASAKYDDKFFEENTLMLVYIPANSGSLRFDVVDVFCDTESYCIHVRQTNNPEVVTEDMAGWFITATEQDRTIDRCSQFDADLNNVEK